MKIVHSLWSIPLARSGSTRLIDCKGRWPTARNHWACWMLSALYAKRSYGNIHLVTDDPGAYVLGEILKIPYDSITTKLRTMPASMAPLWAAGKVIAFRLQKEPFFHIDGDVILTKPLKDEFHKAELVIQNFEYDTMKEPANLFYQGAFMMSHGISRAFIIDNSLPRKPQDWWVAGTNENCSTCMSIFGGTGYRKIQRYCDEFTYLINLPWSQRSDIPPHINQVIEQMTLFALAHKEKWEISPLWHPPESRYADKTTGFIHIADGKGDPKWSECVDTLLQQEFPEHFERLAAIFR